MAPCFSSCLDIFPTQRATVTGLVGAMGGMGGFFPPLLLGVFRDHWGVVWPGFLLLSAVACLLWWLNARVFLPREEALAAKLPPELTRTADRVRAGAWATLWTGASDRRDRARLAQSAELRPSAGDLHLRNHFRDLGRHLSLRVWIRKPPTYVYWQRGWQLFKEQGVLRGIVHIVGLAGTHICCSNVHRAPLQTALGDASVAVLGMHAGGR